MTLANVSREVLYPLVDTTILLAIVMFSLLGAFVITAAGIGPFGMFSLPLAIIALPALFRYALYILEARAQGLPAPGLGIELFNWVENFWSLFPLVMLAGMTWFELYLYFNFPRPVAVSVLVLLSAIYPASIAVLGVTRSPFGSLSPVNIVNMIRLCGVDYLWIPLVTAASIFAIYGLLGFGIWLIGLCAALVYVFFLLFSFTGAVLAAHGVMAEVDIDAPLPLSDSETAAALLKARKKVSTHAYGFASRDNRRGAMEHLRKWITTESDTDAACQWFFQEMLKWEVREPALQFAQDYFAHLLSEDRDAEALKLIARCQLEDPRWKPHPRDRQSAIELADKYGRDDLTGLLKS